MGAWRKWTDPPPPVVQIDGDLVRYCVRCNQDTGWNRDPGDCRHTNCGTCGLSLADDVTDEEHWRAVAWDKQQQPARQPYRLV